MFVRNGHATGSILKKDAPGGATPKKRGRPKKMDAPPAAATRAELDTYAAKAGVDDPEDLPNKDAVREAIKEEGR